MAETNTIESSSRLAIRTKASSQSQSASPTVLVSALRSPTAQASPRKSVTFAPAPEVVEYQADREHDAERLQHWRMLREESDGTKYQNRLKNDLLKTVRDLDREILKPAAAETARKHNATRLRDTANGILTDKLTFTQRYVLSKYLTEIAVKWSQLSDEQQWVADYKIGKMQELLQDFRYEYQMVLKGHTIRFAGLPDEDVNRFVRMFCERHPIDQGDLRRKPGAWLRQLKLALDGEAKRWAEQDEIIAAVFHPEVLPHTSWDDVEEVVDQLMQRFKTTKEARYGKAK